MRFLKSPLHGIMLTIKLIKSWKLNFTLDNSQFALDSEWEMEKIITSALWPLMKFILIGRWENISYILKHGKGYDFGQIRLVWGKITTEVICVVSLCRWNDTVNFKRLRNIGNRENLPLK